MPSLSHDYVPLPLDALKLLRNFEPVSLPASYDGPALPFPASEWAWRAFLDYGKALVDRGQYLIQVKDAYSIPFTLGTETQTAERFLFGPEWEVELAALAKGLIDALSALAPKMPDVQTLKADAKAVVAELEKVFDGLVQKMAPAVDASTAAKPTVDLTNLVIDPPENFAMGWTTFEDAYRLGMPHLPAYTDRLTDADAATRDFWPSLASTGSPYNLLVLRQVGTVDHDGLARIFGAVWNDLSKDGLYVIDLRMFTGIAPGQASPDAPVRFTPNTVTLLTMGSDKTIQPIAVAVADPMAPDDFTIFLPKWKPTWLYALLAARTSLTVYGTWLGHVYTLHLETAALQMAMYDTLGKDHPVRRMVEPQSNCLISFDLLLIALWRQAAPPTSIDDPGKFLTLCNAFAKGRKFPDGDPRLVLKGLGLDVADFTDPERPGGEWNLYPNVQTMLRIWDATAAYVEGVVDAYYDGDLSVLGDFALQAWRVFAGEAGNVDGLPFLTSKANLEAVLTGMLYRVNFHGAGRLRDTANPAMTFVPNFPPCLQIKEIPSAGSEITTSMLMEYLPRTGTVGSEASFYNTFSFTQPTVPLVPYGGVQDEPFFPDDAEGKKANAALRKFREDMVAVMADLQPDYVQTGQWPRNIEL